MAKWAVAEAKAKFSAVLDKAENEGPQLVERRKRRFVLMTEEELARRMQVPAEANAPVAGERSGKRLWDALRCPPEDGIDVEFPRLKWKPRKVEF
jgi:PHD/YefM family antitoxin component YafN of YafNO toxin-antitoxin module